MFLKSNLLVRFIDIWTDQNSKVVVKFLINFVNLMILVENDDWFQHTGWGDEAKKAEESKCNLIFGHKENCLMGKWFLAATNFIFC